MKNTLLGRLRVGALSVAGALSLLLPGGGAAAETPSVISTNAVFAREVQVDTAARWTKEGSLQLGARGLLSSPSAGEEWLYNQFSRLRPQRESFEVTLSYRLTDMVSLYGGGWLLSALAPGSLRPRAAKFGLDFASPWLFYDRSLQPVGAAEVRSQHDYDWSTDFSLRTGLRWNNPRAPARSLSLMLECFVGTAKTPVPGARQKMDYLGLGLHYGW